jgi:hypothetical protein
MMERLHQILLGAGLLIVLGLIGFGIYSCRNHQQSTAAVAQADQHHEQAIVDAAQGKIFDQAVVVKTPILKTNSKEVARLKAEVARLKQEATVIPPALGAANPALDIAKDQLIAAQGEQVQDLEQQVENLTLSRDAWKASAEASQRETGNLHTALGKQPSYRPRAISLIYGTDKTMGVGAEYDMGPVRVGLDVVRHPAGATGRTTLEAVGRIGWRF